MAFAPPLTHSFGCAWTFSHTPHAPTDRATPAPPSAVHTVPTARRAKAPPAAPLASSRAPTSQAAAIDDIVNTIVPVIDTLPASSAARSTRRKSSFPSIAAPTRRLRSRSADIPPSDVQLPSNLEIPDDIDSPSPTPSMASATTQTKVKKTTRRRRSASTPPSAVDVVPDTPAVPSVTPEESSFLNEQIEKRKQQRAQQALKKEARAERKKAPATTNKSVKKGAAAKSTAATALKRSRNGAVAVEAAASQTTLISSNRVNTSSSSLQDTFRAYMAEISQNDLLGQAEVVELAHQIREGMAIEREQKALESRLGHRPSVLQLSEAVGLPLEKLQRVRMMGTAAKNSLVAANLRLVTSVANKILKSKNSSSMQGLTIDDMVQEGSVGLIRAAEKFDVTKGYRFSTYATWWVRAYVMRSITNQGRCIKVPSSIIDEYIRIKRKYTELRGRTRPLANGALDEQVAAELGITVGKLRMVVNVVTQVPTSLDIHLDAFDSGSSSSSGGSSAPGRSLGEIVKGDDHVEEKMVEEMEKHELDAAMKEHLRPVERAVIRLRFGLDDGQARSFRETGEVLGLSKERIRQIVFRALPKLKTPEIQRMLHQAASRD